MLKRWMRFNADAQNEGGFANKARKKRNMIFESFFYSLFYEKINGDEKVEILDIGGTNRYWKSMQFKYFNSCKIVLANIEPDDYSDKAENIRSIIADATNLSGIGDRCFDLVFSNSCIEHVGKEAEWNLMADEIKRVSIHFFLQTPNRYFPIEPHFLFPFFQFLPLKIRAFLINRFQLGFWPKGKDWNDSLKIADEIRLLSYKDLKKLFPEATIRKEKFFGLTKSFMVYM